MQTLHPSLNEMPQNCHGWIIVENHVSYVSFVELLVKELFETNLKPMTHPNPFRNHFFLVATRRFGDAFAVGSASPSV